MQPFLDSTDVVNDELEIRKRAQRDGYLFIRGLIPTDVLENLRMQCLEIARDAGWVKKDSPLKDAIADLDGFCVEPQPDYMGVYLHMYKLQEFQALQHHPNLIGVMERNIGRASDAPCTYHWADNLPATRGVHHATPSRFYSHPRHSRHLHRMDTIDGHTAGIRRTPDCVRFASARYLRL